MSSLKSKYICSECSFEHTKFWGWCQKCSARNTLEEATVNNPLALVHTAPLEDRFYCNWPEVDEFFGNGIVAGAVLLLSGEPGIGKSTFLSQLCSKTNAKTVYFSGEESMHQIQLRAQRLKLKPIQIIATSRLQEITTFITQERPQLAVIDSIQTLTAETGSGSIEQIRQCTFELIQLAKITNTALILVGHVTKSGSIAGPKLLEHMVDVVLNFEGEQEVRILRSTKNRFGSTQEFVLFEMTEDGLQVVRDPSIRLCRKHNKPMIGSIIFPSIEGSRPILVEIQALVSNSYLQMPRRSVLGWDYNRLAMIVAVLEKHAKISLGPKDIYLNVIGGLKITDNTSMDLPAALAIISSVKDLPVPSDMCAFGEITLSGEVRSVARFADREKIAKKHGVSNIVSAAEIDMIKNLQSILKN
jgi:DNA repair protein RadA/Sms